MFDNAGYLQVFPDPVDNRSSFSTFSVKTWLHCSSLSVRSTASCSSVSAKSSSSVPLLVLVQRIRRNAGSPTSPSTAVIGCR